jgi:hypothetical protein
MSFFIFLYPIYRNIIIIIMYYETSIGKLSKIQLNNLLKGKNVRVKRGTAHTINLTEEQKYKFNHNTSKGKALTIKLNQEQIAKQGSGIIGDLVGLVHPTAGKLASMVGLGMKKNYGGGMGAGFLENLAKQAAVNLAKTAGKFAVDKSLELGGNFIKGKIEGLGLKGVPANEKQRQALAFGRAKRLANILASGKKPRRKTGRKATPAQLAALAIGRAKRDSNRLKPISGLGLKGVPATEKQRMALALGRAKRAANILASGKKPRRKTGRKATPAQLEALARGRATRDANRRAQFGGALFAAGY